jgi:ribosomal protein S18 acetylase RimI-like enzyme
MKVSLRGFCGLYPYLGLIGVHADSRGLGVGGFLMSQLEKIALESGARRVTLMVSDFNEDAQRFYARLGYRKLGEIPDAVKEGITELVMIKDLK